MVRWVLVFGLVVAGATYSNEAVAEDNPGIVVAGDLPEPPGEATGAVTYSTRWSGTTYVVDLSVAGVRTSIGITAGGSLVRLA